MIRVENLVKRYEAIVLARTPSKEAHDKVLRAALRLIAERGVEGTSMGAIATTSGVSKATVYKYWANKDALLTDVIRKQSAGYPVFESGHPREDMIDPVRAAYFADQA